MGGGEAIRGTTISSALKSYCRVTPPLIFPSLGCSTDGIIRAINNRPAAPLTTLIENALKSKFLLRCLVHRLSQGVLCFQNVTLLGGTRENATLLTTIRNE
jgi:hypothetical protein